MGLFWDLMQQSQIGAQQKHAATLESRVERLERELAETRRIQRLLLERLEATLGQDVDGDGRVG